MAAKLEKPRHNNNLTHAYYAVLEKAITADNVQDKKDQYIFPDTQDLDFAVLGAVTVEDYSLMLQLLELGADPHWAFYGIGCDNKREALSHVSSYLLAPQSSFLKICISTAAIHNHRQLVDYLAVTYDVSCNDLVDWVAQGGYQLWVDELIRQGANPNKAMRGAIAKAHNTLVKHLVLVHKVDINKIIAEEMEEQQEDTPKRPVLIDSPFIASEHRLRPGALDRQQCLLIFDSQKQLFLLLQNTLNEQELPSDRRAELTRKLNFVQSELEQMGSLLKEPFGSKTGLLLKVYQARLINYDPFNVLNDYDLFQIFSHNFCPNMPARATTPMACESKIIQRPDLLILANNILVTYRCSEKLIKIAHKFLYNRFVLVTGETLDLSTPLSDSYGFFSLSKIQEIRERLFQFSIDPPLYSSHEYFSYGEPESLIGLYSIPTSVIESDLTSSHSSSRSCESPSRVSLIRFFTPLSSGSARGRALIPAPPPNDNPASSYTNRGRQYPLRQL